MPVAVAADRSGTKQQITYRRPWLYPAQLAAIFAPQRFAFIEASTKSGKTLGCLIWLFEQLIQCSEGQAVWWVAPWFRASRIAYRRMRFSLRKWPHQFKFNDSEMTITAANGATMFFLSGDNPDALYGEDVQAAVLDEASRMRDTAFHAVRTTLSATGGPMRCIGNVKGRRNWFYQQARKAEANRLSGDSTRKNTHHAKLTWRHSCEAGLVDKQDIDEAREMLPANVFQELYEAEPSDDSGNPFKYRKTVLATGAIVCWGWDLAKSIDWTVGIGLNSKGQIVKVVRFQKSWEDTIDEIKKETGRARALVDSTGVGDPIVERLQKADPMVKKDGMTTEAFASLGTNFEGFKFTGVSKQQLMEGLTLALREWLLVPEGIITTELDVFEYTYTRLGVRYSAPDGSHDDAVCATALAAWLWEREFRNRAAINAGQLVSVGAQSKWKGH